MDDLDELEKLFDQPPLKLKQITINADTKIKSSSQTDEYCQEVLNLIRKIVFQTTQMYKTSLLVSEQELLETLQKAESLEPIHKLFIKAFYRGQQNGVVDYANALIKALEIAIEKNSSSQ